MASDPTNTIVIRYCTSLNIKFRGSVATIHKNSRKLAFGIPNNFTHKYKHCQIWSLLIHTYSIIFVLLPPSFSFFFVFCLFVYTSNGGTRHCSPEQQQPSNFMSYIQNIKTMQQDISCIKRLSKFSPDILILNIEQLL